MVKTRTPVTVTIDAELKQKAIPIIRYELRLSLGRWIDQKLQEVLDDVSRR